MRESDYDYDYHNLAENADELYYYDDGIDEPWVDDDTDGDIIFDEQDQYQDYLNKYDAYYHDIADEIED
ncbi:MAG: hypothetical protein EBT86_13595 [Actinobacteria bacterium]|nr:hypothetical protein [Actinomycetota bacterium]